MKNSVFIYLVSLSFFTLSCREKYEIANSKTVSHVKYENGVDSIFTPFLYKTIEKHDITGICIGAVKGDSLIYSKAIGKQNLDEGTPINLNSVFHMASISKLFVATAIIQLYEKGKLKLDDPVVKHLPYFKLTDERFKEITIQQMLSHISGMPDTNNYDWDNPRYDEQALEDYVRSLSNLKLKNNPGSQFSYNNIAYEVLGDLLAKVSGMSFEDYQAKYILEPLEMYQSTFGRGENLPKNWASPHSSFGFNRILDTYPYNRAYAPSSTLHSNVIDMVNWTQAHLNKGTFKGKKILEVESYDLLWKHWYKFNEESYIGLSWFIDSFNGRQIYHHSGSDTGFTTQYVLVPEENMGVIVLANVSGAPLRDITAVLLKTLLK